MTGNGSTLFVPQSKAIEITGVEKRKSAIRNYNVKRSNENLVFARGGVFSLDQLFNG